MTGTTAPREHVELSNERCCSLLHTEFFYLYASRNNMEADKRSEEVETEK